MTEIEVGSDDQAGGSEGQERETLTRRRNQVRSRLLANVDRLEARRHALTDSVDALQKSAKRLLPVLVAGAIGATVVGVAVWSLGRRRRRDIALLPWSRVELNAANLARPKSRSRKLVENLAGTLAMTVARRLAARAVVRWVQNQPTLEATPTR